MSRRKRKVDSGGGGTAPWMNTYADMMTLLLCFFVLLFSFATIDAQKFESIIQSLQGSLGVLDSGIVVDMTPIEATFPGSLNNQETEEFSRIYQQVDNFIKENDLENNVTLVLNERGLLIRMLDATLFDSGKAEIKDEAKYIIEKISDVIKESGKNIRIEGHTDNVPIHTYRYPSNWELSTARAVNVLRYLVEVKNVEPWRLSAVGYGEYHPIDTNSTPEGRQNNRRVDILIINSESNGK
ncbi:OmpA family protein [Lutispora thermophila]|uniref:Chemotaxis protein MotB n=1 Tax=Lutispora thermophila DSM 19022 TaxID=1122184 RepID=A0A1M6G799_9FIRM|nr:OmpA family protein [Lutispora thermophila]SHJ05803.1 chemotaxis protein MotB [Lutispora thermophila DSM 19022]